MNPPNPRPRRSHIRTIVLAIAALGVGIGLAQGCSAKHEKLPQVAIFTLLSHPILDDSIRGIREGLAEHGFGPEQVAFLEVNANGETDKLNAFAREILSAKPAVVVPVSTPVTQAVAKEAAPIQAVVFSTVTNPGDVGMDRKPANMTGVSDAVNYEANLGLIQSIRPDARRVGIIYNAGEKNSQFGVDRCREIAKPKNLTLEIVSVSRSDEVADAARSLLGKVDAFYVGSDNTVVAALAGLIKVAYDAKIPVIASDSGSVANGALAAVSVDYTQLGRKVGEIVAEVLRTGRKPGEIPNVMFQGNRLLLNLAAARQLGIELPADLRTKAAEILDK